MTTAGEVGIHIYRAKDQPATRFWVDLSTFEDGELKRRGFWSKHPARRTFHCGRCKRWRIAANLVAHVYYDGTYFFCRKGKGCKP